MQESCWVTSMLVEEHVSTREFDWGLAVVVQVVVETVVEMVEVDVVVKVEAEVDVDAELEEMA